MGVCVHTLVHTHAHVHTREYAHILVHTCIHIRIHLSPTQVSDFQSHARYSWAHSYLREAKRVHEEQAQPAERRMVDEVLLVRVVLDEDIAERRHLANIVLPLHDGFDLCVPRGSEFHSATAMCVLAWEIVSSTFMYVDNVSPRLKTDTQITWAAVMVPQRFISRPCRRIHTYADTLKVEVATRCKYSYIKEG